MEDDRQTRIRQNLEDVQDRIRRACVQSGRRVEEVKLVVVCKSQPIETVRMAMVAGVKVFGENYAEEALKKISGIGDTPGIEWHMIGHVQSRKARFIAGNFALIHSLDSVKLADKYNSIAQEKSIIIPVLIELNLGGEASKSGWPAWNDLCLAQLMADLDNVIGLPHLSIRGLMTMPPISPDPETSREYFKKLREIRNDLARRYPLCSWADLSMGTSADFEVGVQEGATLVRVGQAILGPRVYRTELANN